MNEGRAFALRPLLEATVGDLGPLLLILFGATGLLLALAAANVINLILARSTGRVREMAVRAALGAGRPRLVAHLISETMLLSLAGGLAGVAAAYGGVHLLMRLGGSRLPRLATVSFDARVAAFTETSRSVRGSRKTRRLLSLFVVAEIAVAVALVAGAVRLVRSYQQLTRIDPGFEPRGRLVLDVLLPPSYLTQERRNAWWQATEDRLREAGAQHVASSSSLPLQHEWDSTTFVDLVSRPGIPPEKRPNARIRMVSADFFTTMGIRLLTGRSFVNGDGPASQPVAIVNEAFVRRSLGDVDPLRERIKGVKFRVVDKRLVDEEVAIVGVAADVKYSVLTAEPEPVLYVPATQFLFPRASIVITTPDGRPEARVAQWRSAVAAVDPKIPVETRVLSAVVASSLERQRIGMWLMSGFGFAALLLAMVGVFGVIAYVVSQRYGEMAIRQTLGATRSQVFWIVMRDGMQIAAAGLASGAILAWWTGRLVGRYVYDVRPADPFVLGGSAAVVAVVAILATLGPAARASTREFARALRQE
jgi:putative ABC transport system permease protein